MDFVEEKLTMKNEGMVKYMVEKGVKLGLLKVVEIR